MYLCLNVKLDSEKYGLKAPAKELTGILINDSCCHNLILTSTPRAGVLQLWRGGRGGCKDWHGNRQVKKPFTQEILLILLLSAPLQTQDKGDWSRGILQHQEKTWNFSLPLRSLPDAVGCLVKDVWFPSKSKRGFLVGREKPDERVTSTKWK